jgi:hypothetical protein
MPDITVFLATVLICEIKNEHVNIFMNCQKDKVNNGTEVVCFPYKQENIKDTVFAFSKSMMNSLIS